LSGGAVVIGGRITTVIRTTESVIILKWIVIRLSDSAERITDVIGFVIGCVERIINELRPDGPCWQD